MFFAGTSGDTGSAAIEAVRGKEWLDIVVLLPQGRCTKIQELQMTTVLDDNVHNFCGKVIVGLNFKRSSYNEQHELCSLWRAPAGDILLQYQSSSFSLLLFLLAVLRKLYNRQVPSIIDILHVCHCTHFEM